MGSGNSDLNGREPHDEVPAARARRRWPWATALVAVAVAAVAGGVALAGNLGPGSQAPVAGSTATATTAPSASAATAVPSPTNATPSSVPPSASATPAPSAGSWQTFTTPDGRISFDHPGSWKVSSPQGASTDGSSGSVDLDVPTKPASLWLPCTPGRTAGSAAPARARCRTLFWTRSTSTSRTSPPRVPSPRGSHFVPCRTLTM